MAQSLLTGFFSSLALILAIGAQNAFVLRQGLRREHVFWVCLTCAVSDALLIGAGIAGLGSIVEAFPSFERVMRWGGAAFLFAYGLRNFASAWRGGQVLAADDEHSETALPKVLLTCLALTWLNPHVYLDTVLLLGSIASRDPSPVVFGVGAASASFVFFFTLGFGARALAPWFASPRTWRALDVFVGLIMWLVAAALLW